MKMKGTHRRGGGSVSLKLPAPTMRSICITEGFGAPFRTLFLRGKGFVAGTGIGGFLCSESLFCGTVELWN